MRVLAIIVLLISCSGDNHKRSDSKPAATGSGASAVDRAAAPASGCTDRVARIEKELRALSAITPGFLPLVNGIDTPASTAGKPFDARGFVVAVTREGHAYVQGHRIDTADARSYFREMEMRAVEQVVMDGGSARDAKFPLYIWADRETTAGAVAELLSATEPEPAKKNPPQNLTKEQLEARTQAIEQARKAGVLGGGADKASPRFLPRLLVAGTTAARPGSSDATAAAAKLPANEPEATKYLAEQLRGAIGTCKPMITWLATASLAGTPVKQADELVASLIAGLKDCECKIGSFGVFEWGVSTWFGAWAPPLAWIDMPKLTAGDKQPIGELVK